MGWRRLKVSNWRVEVGRALGSAEYFRTGGGLFVGRELAHVQEGDVALNDGKDVVEIMGDAGGQLAEGLHLLGLAELRFQLLAFRQIP